MFANENAFDADIAINAQRYGVPTWVVKATIGKESSFNPRAIGPEATILSRGLMQLIPETAVGLGYRGIQGDDAARAGGLYDPGISIALGTKLLAQLRDRYPAAPWDDIYAGYNAGSIRRTAAGALVNESNVTGWRRLADYFRPGWRSPANPTMPARPPRARRRTRKRGSR